MTTTGWTGSLFDAAPVFDSAALMRGLNPAQRDAVAHDDGPMLVLAGAGSGKTKVLTTRIVRLIAERGVPAHEILAVTFTNKAAGEMRRRIAAQLGREPKGMWCGTFHALGARMLRGIAPLVGRAQNFTIYDEDDALAACKRVMERRQISPKQFSPNAVLHAISDAKNALVSSSEYATTARDPFAQAVAGVYSDLETALERANAVTFDDLLVLPVRAMERDTALREHYQRRFRYVLVDEYQDTNAAQYRFVSLMGGGYHNVMVVGDDDQSIYGWRGADIRNILDFERGFPGAKVVRLEENYRSTPSVLALANAVIAENTERRGKTLRATRPAGGMLVTLEIDEGLASEARQNFARAGVSDRVSVVVGDAQLKLAKLSGPFDFVFQDGDKTLYTPLLDRLVALLRPGGLLVTDNVLWDGEVVPGFQTVPRQNPDDTRAIIEYNQRVADHPALLTSIVPLRDGVSISVKHS